MKVRALVVDDSGFFRRRIKEMLDADPAIEVVGEAGNGQEAIAQVEALRPDVVTMDIEMPVMDGIQAVRKIMQQRPTPVLMFSSLTYDGARATLDALEAGALDFLPKRFADISTDAEQAKKELQNRVRTLGRRAGMAMRSAAPRPAPARPTAPEPGRPTRPAPATGAQPVAPTPEVGSAVRATDFDLVIIGASTGGPAALQKVLTKLPGNFPVPILLIQHMPANFTAAFADRVNELCDLEVTEAKDGDVLRPGRVLLAPGGKQLGVRRSGGLLAVHTFEASPDQFYRPSVDIAFTEASRACGRRVLGIVLTGMGADGAQGAKLLKQAGAKVWAQDEATSVIYGMPAAVARAGLADRVLALDAVAVELARCR